MNPAKLHTATYKVRRRFKDLEDRYANLFRKVRREDSIPLGDVFELSERTESIGARLDKLFEEAEGRARQNIDILRKRLEIYSQALVDMAVKCGYPTKAMSRYVREEAGGSRISALLSDMKET